MTTAYDVPADVLIGKLSGYIKENIKEVTAPEWAAHVKTGSHVERVPQVPDWWYVRTASLLRKLYMNGPVGVQRLRKEYGGRKRKGDAPAHHRKAGGSIIRTSLQQLEKAGLVDKVDKSGRVVSKKGRSLLDAMSTQIKKDLDREKPELKAY
ncbi:MAG: 30S ribosomal protein S19e [Candidatus Bathyarchaeota archaeon]|jgi:small subunit ribosomal protein S19e|nr:30S ribosomal protein S19e [Candidatus Bathyarchaeota archaeon]